MRQSDVYWYKFKPPDKRRPVVILTRDEVIPHLSALVVAPITSTIRQMRSHIVLTKEDGVWQTSAVRLDNIQTVQKNQLEGFIIHLSDEKMVDIYLGIMFALGFEKYIKL